jgi:hypothetical protein
MAAISDESLSYRFVFTLGCVATIVDVLSTSSWSRWEQQVGAGAALNGHKR